VLGLFTVDAVLDRWGQPVSGQVELRHWLDTRPQEVLTRHVCTNFEPSRSADDKANGTTFFTFYRAPTQERGQLPPPFELVIIGEYLDRFRLTPAEWRIARRETRILMQK